MKRVKNYITTDLAKKKIARYKFWSIKDENGITITSSDDDKETRSFSDILDKIISDNVDAEVQVKFGTNEQSSRQNNPLFIRINQDIEWIEPPEEEEESVKINGVPHKVDKNGNVNINFKAEAPEAIPVVETPSEILRQEMELQLQGIKRESELKEKRFQDEMHNKLAEQTLHFKELMLSERESRLSLREEALKEQLERIEEKRAEIEQSVKAYVRHIPSALGSLVKEWMKIKNPPSNLGKADKKEVKRNTVRYHIEDDDETDTTKNAKNSVKFSINRSMAREDTAEDAYSLLESDESEYLDFSSDDDAKDLITPEPSGVSRDTIDNNS